MTSRQAIVLALALVSATMALLAFDTAAAGPPALAPTEEPTKRPYLFPTPIFIPTYPTEIASATAVPARTTGNTTAPASLPVGAQSYTVQSGDNPWTIAQKVCGNGTKGTVILAENGITDPTKLRVGTVLKIPAGCAGNASVQTAMATPQAPQLSVATPMTVSFSVPAATPVASTRADQSASGAESNLLWQIGMLAVNLGSGLLMLGSIISGGSAWMVYRRTRFLRAVSVRVQRLRSRHR